MSTACGCEHDEPETADAEEAEEAERPWWRDRGIMVPVLSGVAFLTGLVLEWSGLEILALVLFWLVSPRLQRRSTLVVALAAMVPNLSRVTCCSAPLLPSALYM